VNVFLSKTAEKASIITTNISEVNVFTYNGEDQVLILLFLFYLFF